jgi:hypothetical protein
MGRTRFRRRVLTIAVLVALLWAVVPTAAAEDVWTGVPRVVAIGDVHGDYDQFLGLLLSAGLVDERGRWTGGKAHLVQTGDVLDRGPGSRKAMDLLMALQRQARSAGGAVHALIGNHEAMNLYGDLRYVSPEEFAAFQTKDSEKVRTQLYERYIDALRKTPPATGIPTIDEAHRKKFDDLYPLGYVEHRQAFGPDGVYGRWLREQNAVVKVNDSVFLHGGISPKYATWSIRRINDAVRAELAQSAKLAVMSPDEIQLTVVGDQEGPLWYRELVIGREGDLEAPVSALLQALGAARMVVGHTINPGVILPRVGGRIVSIDVGLASTYAGGPAACLIIEGSRLFALHRGTRLELPGPTGTSVLEYLKRAAALDPAPSRLQKSIDELERTLAPTPAGAGEPVTPRDPQALQPRQNPTRPLPTRSTWPT